MVRALAVGAGVEQVYFIRETQKMNIHVIAIDGDPNAVGLSIANESYHLNLKDEKAVLSCVSSLDIDFVIPSPIGYLITLVGTINDKFNLPGITRKQAEILANKQSFISFQKKQGMYCPKEIVIEHPTIESMKTIINSFNTSCVLRPSKGSGSRGVIAIKEATDELIQEHLSSLYHGESSIITEFVEGLEYGIDVFVINGEVNIIAIRQKDITALPYRQETGFTIVHDALLHKRISQEISLIVKGLNIMNAIMHVDVIVNEQAVFIVEASPRPSGLGIYSNLLSHVYDESLVTYYIGKGIFKKDIKLNKVIHENIGIYFWDINKGRVSRLPSNKGLLTFELNINVGDDFQEIKSGKDMYLRGYYVIKANSKEELERLILNIKNSVVDMD